MTITNNARVTTIHGAFISLWDMGTLLIGASGIGKSDLALSLVDRGHQFVADDVIEFTPSREGVLIGQAPLLLKNFIHIRGVGVINVADFFGATAVLEKQVLSLVIQLEKPASLSQKVQFDCFPWTCDGIDVPTFCLPLTVNRPQEILVETIVRHYRLTQKGNYTDMKFMQNQRKALSVL